MLKNTRLIFKTLLRRFAVDCLLDIGACDGSESLVFRQVLPEAKIIAFEPNPHLYKRIVANPAFAENRITVLPFALSNTQGTSSFHVTDIDYDNIGDQNPGTSSLLYHDGLKIKETVQVQTVRVDQLLAADAPEAKTVGLWIDAEGAEFEVIEGIAGIKKRIAVIHVETANKPMRAGQRTYSELEPLLKTLGFSPLCANMGRTDLWGDVVFVNDDRIGDLGFRYHFCDMVATTASFVHLDSFGGFLKKHCHFVYRPLWAIYVRLFT
jgi:FkbM family methyltransferase